MVLNNIINEWTKDLDLRESRIKIFERIRDIPYGIIPYSKNDQEGSIEILNKNKGSCQPKHFFLGLLFEKLGIPVKYVSYEFIWAEQDIKYPKEIKELAQKLPPQYHFAFKALIDGKWIFLDATWDSSLKKFGLPVNEWDGINDTLNAVKPVKEIIHANPSERIQLIEDMKKNLSEVEKKVIAEFIERFNSWIDKARLSTN